MYKIKIQYGQWYDRFSYEGPRELDTREWEKLLDRYTFETEEEALKSLRYLATQIFHCPESELRVIQIPRHNSNSGL